MRKNITRRQDFAGKMGNPLAVQTDAAEFLQCVPPVVRKDALCPAVWPQFGRIAA
jgi:hypothetical protein